MIQKKIMACVIAITGMISAVEAQESTNSLTLDQALNIAFENSPDIRRAELNLTQSQQLLQAAKMDQKTQFRFNITPVDYSRRRSFNDGFNQWQTIERYSYYGEFVVSQPVFITDGTVSLINRLGWQNSSASPFVIEGVEVGGGTNKAFSNNLFMAYNQPLFTYNRIKMQYQELEISLERSQLNYSIQELAIERNVTQSFYDVYREQENLAITYDEYQNQQKNYEIVKNKVESGLLAREELFQSEVNLANSESSWKNQQVTLDNAKDDLKLILGLDLYQSVEITANITENFPDIRLDFAIQEGLKNRQELKQSEMDIQLAENDMIRTKSENEFRGDLSMEMGLFGENQDLGEVYSRPVNSPSVRLDLTIPLYDWGAKKARVKAQEAVIETQQLNLSDQEKDIIINIRRSYRSLQNLRTQIDIAEKSLRNAQLTYEINQERYENGDITGLDLNQYQNQLSQSRIDLTTARINYRLELLNMKIQSLWDFENNRSLLDAQ